MNKARSTARLVSSVVFSPVTGKRRYRRCWHLDADWTFCHQGHSKHNDNSDKHTHSISNTTSSTSCSDSDNLTDPSNSNSTSNTTTKSSIGSLPGPSSLSMNSYSNSSTFDKFNCGTTTSPTVPLPSCPHADPLLQRAFALATAEGIDSY